MNNESNENCANSESNSSRQSLETDEQDDNTYEPSYESIKGKVFDGEYSPVFPSFTAVALSIYLHLSKTSRKDFSSLLKILWH